jgi:hypothetical protein
MRVHRHLRRSPIFLLAIWILASAAGRVTAAPPTVLSYQGNLATADQEAVDGVLTFTFRLFDDAETGAVLWSETLTDVVVEAGHFSVLLGESTTFASEGLDFSIPYYLEIEVGGEVLTPRVPLTAAPYAMSADRLTPEAIGDGLALGAGGVVSVQGVVSGMIVDGTIADADVAADAAIAPTKIAGTAVTLNGIETLTGKTLDLPVIRVADSALTVVDNDAPDRTLQLELGLLTPGAPRTLSVPDADGTLVLEHTEQSLTGKLLNADANTFTNLRLGAFATDALVTDLHGSPPAAHTSLPTALAVREYVDSIADGQDTLAELDDVLAGAPADADLLVYNGTHWTSTTVSGDALLSETGVWTIAPDAVALGDDTTGDYVRSLVGGDAVMVGGARAEGADLTLDLMVDNASLGIDTAGLHVRPSGIGPEHIHSAVAGSGLTGGDGSPLDVVTGHGLSSGTEGVGLVLGNDSLALDADGLRVGVLGAEHLAHGSVTDAHVATDAGITDTKLATIQTAGKVAGSAVQLAPDGGLEDSGGLAVKLDGAGLVSGPGGLSLAPLSDDQIPDSVTASRYLPLEGGALAGPVDLGGHALSGLPMPAGPDAAAPRAYVDSLSGTIYWQAPVIDVLGTPPEAWAEGDRYIAAGDSADWTAQRVYEARDGAWQETVPQAGTAAWVDNAQTAYVFTGTTWAPMATTHAHNQLTALQGGNGVDEFYHLSAAEHGYVSGEGAQDLRTTASPTFAGVQTGNATVTGGTVAGTDVDMTGQTLTLDPGQISGDAVTGGTVAGTDVDMTGQTLTLDPGQISGDAVTGGTVAGTDVDMTGQTLTLESDQISGDAVEGGTIDGITIADLITNDVTVNSTFLAPQATVTGTLDASEIHAGTVMIDGAAAVGGGLAVTGDLTATDAYMGTATVGQLTTDQAQVSGSLQAGSLVSNSSVSGASAQFGTVRLDGAPSLADQATTKAYVDNLVQGLSWQRSVTSREAAPPSAYGPGDRFIATADSETWVTGSIYEADDAGGWQETTPEQGFAVWVENEDAQYVFSSDGDWVRLASTQQHGNLSGLQGGDGADQFYHLTGSEHGYVSGPGAQDLRITAAPTFAGLQTGNATITGGTIAGADIDVTGQTLTLDPGQISGDAVSGGTLSGTDLDMTGQTLTLDPGQISGDAVSGGTIDTITVSNATVTGGTISGTDLDMTGQTLTLDPGQISGDAVSGGTIDTVTVSNLTSGNATITGGTIDGALITNSTVDSTPIGTSAPASGTFTNLKATGMVTLGDGPGDVVNVAGMTAFSGVVMLNQDPTADLQAATKQYVDNLVQGLDWQRSVIDLADTPPAEPSEGDRYVAGPGAGTPWTPGLIYEYHGGTWQETPPVGGFALWVQNLGMQYVFNGSAWVELAATQLHNNLSGLQGGDGTDQFYHLSGTEHGYVSGPDAQDLRTTAAPTFAGLQTGNATITGGTIAGADIDMTGQALTLGPGQVSGDAISGGTIDTVTVSNLTSSNATVTGGTVDGVPIGSSAPASGAFTELSTTGKLRVGATTESTDSTTGALTVAGGAGVAGNVNVGGDLTVEGRTTLILSSGVVPAVEGALRYSTELKTIEFFDGAQWVPVNTFAP